jgi:hypothetical protein
MPTKNDETVIVIQNAQKENWEKPELSKLDINKTESGLNTIGEVSILTAPLQS